MFLGSKSKWLGWGLGSAVGLGLVADYYTPSTTEPQPSSLEFKETPKFSQGAHLQNNAHPDPGTDSIRDSRGDSQDTFQNDLSLPLKGKLPNKTPETQEPQEQIQAETSPTNPVPQDISQIKTLKDLEAAVGSEAVARMRAHNAVWIDPDTEQVVIRNPNFFKEETLEDILARNLAAKPKQSADAHLDGPPDSDLELGHKSKMIPDLESNEALRVAKNPNPEKKAVDNLKDLKDPKAKWGYINEEAMPNIPKPLSPNIGISRAIGSTGSSGFGSSSGAFAGVPPTTRDLSDNSPAARQALRNQNRATDLIDKQSAILEETRDYARNLYEQKKRILDEMLSSKNGSESAELQKLRGEILALKAQMRAQESTQNLSNTNLRGINELGRRGVDFISNTLSGHNSAAANSIRHPASQTKIPSFAPVNFSWNKSGGSSSYSDFVPVANSKAVPAKNSAVASAWDKGGDGSRNFLGTDGAGTVKKMEPIWDLKDSQSPRLACYQNLKRAQLQRQIENYVDTNLIENAAASPVASEVLDACNIGPNIFNTPLIKSEDRIGSNERMYYKNEPWVQITHTQVSRLKLYIAMNSADPELAKATIRHELRYITQETKPRQDDNSLSLAEYAKARRNWEDETAKLQAMLETEVLAAHQSLHSEQRSIQNPREVARIYHQDLMRCQILQSTPKKANLVKLNDIVGSLEPECTLTQKNAKVTPHDGCSLFDGPYPKDKSQRSFTDRMRLEAFTTKINQSMSNLTPETQRMSFRGPIEPLQDVYCNKGLPMGGASDAVQTLISDSQGAMAPKEAFNGMLSKNLLDCSEKNSWGEMIARLERETRDLAIQCKVQAAQTMQTLTQKQKQALFCQDSPTKRQETLNSLFSYAQKDPVCEPMKTLFEANPLNPPVFIEPSQGLYKESQAGDLENQPLTCKKVQQDYLIYLAILTHPHSRIVKDLERDLCDSYIPEDANSSPSPSSGHSSKSNTVNKK